MIFNKIRSVYGLPIFIICFFMIFQAHAKNEENPVISTVTKEKQDSSPSLQQPLVIKVEEVKESPPPQQLPTLIKHLDTLHTLQDESKLISPSVQFPSREMVGLNYQNFLTTYLRGNVEKDTCFRLLIKQTEKPCVQHIIPNPEIAQAMGVPFAKPSELLALNAVVKGYQGLHGVDDDLRVQTAAGQEMRRLLQVSSEKRRRASPEETKQILKGVVLSIFEFMTPEILGLSDKFVDLFKIYMKFFNNDSLVVPQTRAACGDLLTKISVAMYVTQCINVHKTQGNLPSAKSKLARFLKKTQKNSCESQFTIVDELLDQEHFGDNLFGKFDLKKEFKQPDVFSPYKLPESKKKPKSDDFTSKSDDFTEEDPLLKKGNIQEKTPRKNSVYTPLLGGKKKRNGCCYCCYSILRCLGLINEEYEESRV